MASPLRGLVLLLAFFFSLHIAAAVTVQEACQQHTKYPELCVKALSPALPSDAAPGGLTELAEIAIAVAEERNNAMLEQLKKLENQRNGIISECLQKCVGQFNSAVSELKRSDVALKEFGDNATGVKGWVGSAKTDVETCVKGCNTVELDANRLDVDGGSIGDLDKLNCRQRQSLASRTQPSASSCRDGFSSRKTTPLRCFHMLQQHSSVSMLRCSDGTEGGHLSVQSCRTNVP